MAEPYLVVVAPHNYNSTTIGLAAAIDDLAQPRVGGVPVPPGDVAADHAGLVGVARVVGAVHGEVAQRGELGLDAVEPGGVRRGVSDLDVVRLGPVRDPTTLLRRQVRGEVVADDRDPDLGRVEGAQVAAERQELGTRCGA